MTVETDNNEPYRQSKEHVLNDYFDDLFVEDISDSKLLPSEVIKKDVIKEPIEEPIKEPREKLKKNLESSNEHLSFNASIKAQKYVEDVIKPQDIPKVISKSESIIQPVQSESLAPLMDKKPAALKNESAAYQAHKQRLEKMLQQLTPVNTLPTLSEPSTKTIIPEVLPAEPEPENLTSTSIDTNVSDPEPQALIAKTVSISSAWLDNDRPNWAQEIFDILLIDVNGLKLALPLVALGHIEPITDDLTPLFGQAEWFLGLQKTPFGNIKAIDTAQYVMPEKNTRSNDKAYQFVVSINGMNWGLAVDSIDQPIAIDPETIRWRAKRSNRPWMAGTVKDHMCILLDIPVMGEILQKEDQNHRNPTGE